MSRPTLSCRIGVAGSGKTLSCVIWAVTEFLRFETGKLITNLPFLPEKIADALQGSKGVNGPMTREEIIDRFVFIPDEVLEGWKEEQGGPWEWLEGQSIAGAHIMLDEAHNFVGSKHNAKWRKRWQSWIGELRHQGATLELVTQAEGKLAKEFKEEAERHVIVINSETRREPVFGILGGDLAQLAAKFVPKYGYRVSTIVEEKRNNGGRKFVTEDVKKFGRDPYYFALYDSHNTPTAGGVSGRRQLQYETLGTLDFLRWFLTRNAWSILSANVTKMCLLAAFLITPTTRNWLTGFFKSSLEAQRKNSNASFVKSAAAAPPPVRKDPQPTLAPGADMVIDANRTTQAMGSLEGQVRRSEALSLEQKDAVIRELQEAREAQERAFEINQEFVGLVGDELLMRNGDRYALKERINTGPLIGRQVLEIDRRRRELVLDDGQRIKLGGVPRPVPAGGTASDGTAGADGAGKGKGVPQAVRRDPVGETDESGRALGATSKRGPVRSGTASRPGLGFGSVQRVDRGGSGPTRQSDRNEAGQSDGR